MEPRKKQPSKQKTKKEKFLEELEKGRQEYQKKRKKKIRNLIISLFVLVFLMFLWTLSNIEPKQETYKPTDYIQEANQSETLTDEDTGFDDISNSKIFGIPLIFWIMAVIGFMLFNTPRRHRIF